MLYKQERFAEIKICNFVCFSAILENQKCSVTFDFEHTYIEKWCYASGVYK